MTDPDTIREALEIGRSAVFGDGLRWQKLDDALTSLDALAARLRTLENALRGLEFKHGCWCVDGESPEGHELACKAARAALAAAETRETP